MTGAMTGDAFSLRRAVVDLGGFRLGPVDLSLERGGYLVLLGPSGCGKTTLLRALAGAHALAAGHLVIDGREASALAPHERGVGYVSQTSDLFPHLDVAGNVAFGLRYLRGNPEEERERLARLARLVGIDHLWGRKVGALSGGESRRVALARSLAIRPRLLLLDEPLGMLDPNSRAAVLASLREVHRELGTATVHVTHDREEALAIGRTAAVMREGGIEQTAPVREIFERPASGYVATFLGAENVFDALFESGAVRLGWATVETSASATRGGASAMLRPELIEPAAEGERADAEATVVSVVDRGAYRRVELEPAEGVRLVAHLGRSARPVEPGERLRLRLAGALSPIDGRRDG